MTRARPPSPSSWRIHDAEPDPIPCSSASARPLPRSRNENTPCRPRTVRAGNRASSASTAGSVARSSIVPRLRALDLGERMIRRISRRLRFWGAEHYAHQGVFLADVDFAAIDSRRDRNQVAFPEDGLVTLA